MKGTIAPQRSGNGHCPICEEFDPVDPGFVVHYWGAHPVTAIDRQRPCTYIVRVIAERSDFDYDLAFNQSMVALEQQLEHDGRQLVQLVERAVDPLPVNCSGLDRCPRWCWFAITAPK